LHVFIAKSNDTPLPHANEIEAIRWVSPEELEREFISHPEQFTPWFSMIWEKIKDQIAL
jgi:isopentenyl-diphosphate delta-isomerase